MAKQRTILLAHYDSSEISAWRSALEAEGLRIQATASGADVLRRIETTPIDAVVLEVLLPRLNGLSVLKSIKGRPAGAGIPCVIVVDDGDNYTENRALISGADAIIRRTPDGVLPLETLTAKVKSLLVEHSLGEGRGPSTAELEILESLADRPHTSRSANPVISHISDPLTGLFNGDYFQIKLADEYKRSRRYGTPVSLMSLEVKGAAESSLDVQNPEWRHVLNEIAGKLLCESRDIDVLGRTSATSFSLLLPNTDGRGAQIMAERVLSSIMQHFTEDEHNSPRLLAAVGIVEYAGRNAESAEDLERVAQEALKAAWKRGAFQAVVAGSTSIATSNGS